MLAIRHIKNYLTRDIGNTREKNQTKNQQQLTQIFQRSRGKQQRPQTIFFCNEKH